MGHTVTLEIELDPAGRIYRNPHSCVDRHGGRAVHLADAFNPVPFVASVWHKGRISCTPRASQPLSDREFGNIMGGSKSHHGGLQSRAVPVLIRSSKNVCGGKRQLHGFHRGGAPRVAEDRVSTQGSAVGASRCIPQGLVFEGQGSWKSTVGGICLRRKAAHAHMCDQCGHENIPL